MGNKVRSMLLRHLHLRETWVVFFILGLIMLNFPFIHIFYTPRRVLGIPLLFLYLILGWMISIFVIWLFVKAIDLPDEENGERR